MGLESRRVKPITPPRDGRKNLSRSCRSAAGSFDFMSASYAEDLGAIRRAKRGVGAMQYVLMIYQIAACRDYLRCTIYRLCSEIPRDFRSAALTE
jgi:hypothetical protein